MSILSFIYVSKKFWEEISSDPNNIIEKRASMGIFYYHVTNKETGSSVDYVVIDKVELSVE